MRFVLVLLLAGCTSAPELWKSQTPEERARLAVEDERRAAEEAKKQAEKIIATHAPLCDKLGYARDSDGWRNCVLQGYAAAQREEQERKARGAAAYGAMQRSRPRTCSFIGNTMNCY